MYLFATADLFIFAVDLFVNFYLFAVQRGVLDRSF